VGEFVLGTETFMLGYTWNGTTWTQANVGEIPLEGAAIESLYAVSCKSSTSCMAVGYWTSSFGRRPAVMIRNGATWQWSQSPSAVTGSLTGVSCDSTTSCHLWGTRLGATTAALRWQSGVYTTYTTPNPTPSDNWTTGLSCVSAAVCRATLYNTETWTAFVLELNNGTWTSVAPPPTTVPTSSGVTRVQASAISCTSGTSCIAVGNQSGLGIPYVIHSS
jgi:hypothetical protein